MPALKKRWLIRHWRDLFLPNLKHVRADAQLTQERLHCRAKLKAFNGSDGMTEEEQAQRVQLLKGVVGGLHEDHPPHIEPPFACDYVSRSASYRDHYWTVCLTKTGHRIYETYSLTCRATTSGLGAISVSRSA